MFTILTEAQKAYNKNSIKTAQALWGLGLFAYIYSVIIQLMRTEYTPTCLYFFKKRNPLIVSELGKNSKNAVFFFGI